jgi:hypothetical protein
MAKRLDEILRGLGVDAEQALEPDARRAKTTSPPPASGLPPRFAALLQRDDALRALYEGQAGNNPDQTPSGKDMVLGHSCRRRSFKPEEVREILRSAPYRVAGGRTRDYLDRAIRKIFSETPRQEWASSRKATEGFGMLSARLLDGTWADLSFKAAKLYAVLVIRQMRPSGIVRDGHTTLARWAGISPDSVGPAANELEAKGLIRRAWRWHGVNYWVNDLTCTEENPAHVESAVAAGTGAERSECTDPLPTAISQSTSELSSVHVDKPTTELFPDHVVLVMSGKSPSAARSPRPVERSQDAVVGDRHTHDAAVTHRRCQALTKARLECGLRAVAGSRFCRHHQGKDVVCVPAG